MGDKNTARATARKAGVPITPGSDGIVETEQEALKIAKKIGYPVMIKAVAGGGGKGMRPAHNDVSLVQGFHGARMEADKAFGNPGVYIEKLIENPHHIEFQIMADQHGEVVHIGERDCSMQRRNQKIIEECPSPLMTEALRKKMGAASVKLATTVGYEGAGTMEYLVDDKGNFYFMEMNTRIQVEHTITEEAYGIDLVKEQIKVAAGEPLSHFVRNAKLKYHAIECRVNAEDPFHNFQPSPGKIDLYPWRARSADRFARLCRLHRATALRFDDRESDRHRHIPRQRHRSDAPRTQRIHHSRGEDDNPFPGSDHARPRFHPRDL
jgi:acetyl-CoA carboxylase biotin carboxylase subunit